MNDNALATLATFDIHALPDLDTVVVGALQLLQKGEYPKISFPTDTKQLVIGSGNALSTGKILLRNNQAYFADENSYNDSLTKYNDYSQVVIISASGGKHAVGMAEKASALGKQVILLTNNPEPLAGQYLEKEHIHIFPRNREPYTYNTSTYFSMIFGSTGENPEQVLNHLYEHVVPALVKNFESYKAFTIIVPSRFANATTMIRTKFDELFGPMVVGRVFTEEEMKHAKNVIESPDELTISIGVTNELYGIPEHRLYISLPDSSDFGSVLATGYFVVGKIQAAHPPYFKNSIVSYAQKTSALFNQNIAPIVE